MSNRIVLEAVASAWLAHDNWPLAETDQIELIGIAFVPCHGVAMQTIFSIAVLLALLSQPLSSYCIAQIPGRSSETTENQTSPEKQTSLLR